MLNNFFKKYWIGICSVLTIGVAGFFLSKSSSGYYDYSSEAVGETVGKALAYSLFVFLIANSIRKRAKRKKLEFWIFCFALSFSLCAIYDSVKITKQKRQLSNSTQEITRLVSDYSSEKTQHPPKEYSSEEYGPLGKLLPIIKQSFEFSQNFTSEINAACTELENILIPENLCEHEHLVQSKVKVKSFLKKLDHLENVYHKEIDSLETKIQQAYADNNRLKTCALKGFEKGRAEGAKLVEEYLNIEKGSMRKLDELLTFLLKTSKRFYVSSGTLYFERDEDTETYNKLIREIIEYVAKEDAVTRKIECHQQSLIEKATHLDKG